MALRAQKSTPWRGVLWTGLFLAVISSQPGLGQGIESAVQGSMPLGYSGETMTEDLNRIFKTHTDAGGSIYCSAKIESTRLTAGSPGKIRIRTGFKSSPDLSHDDCIFNGTNNGLLGPGDGLISMIQGGSGSPKKICYRTETNSYSVSIGQKGGSIFADSIFGPGIPAVPLAYPTHSEFIVKMLIPGSNQAIEREVRKITVNEPSQVLTSVTEKVYSISYSLTEPTITSMSSRSYEISIEEADRLMEGLEPQERHKWVPITIFDFVCNPLMM